MALAWGSWTPSIKTGIKFFLFKATPGCNGLSVFIIFKYCLLIAFTSFGTCSLIVLNVNVVYVTTVYIG